MAYTLERSCVMSTAWTNCLDDCEITVELPVRQTSFDMGKGDLRGSQTIQWVDGRTLPLTGQLV